MPGSSQDDAAGAVTDEFVVDVVVVEAVELLWARRQRLRSFGVMPGSSQDDAVDAVVAAAGAEAFGAAVDAGAEAAVRQDVEERLSVFVVDAAGAGVVAAGAAERAAFFAARFEA